MNDDFMILFAAFMIGLIAGMATITILWERKEKDYVYMSRAELVDVGLAHYDREGKFIITIKQNGE